MSGTPKQSGASCPGCLDRCPAEYAQLGEVPRWTCHACGASGPLLGEFAGRNSASSPPTAAPVKKHWSAK